MSTIRDHHQLARSASLRASSALADAVRRGKRWPALDRLVQQVMDCHQEEALLHERLLRESIPPGGGQALREADGGLR